MGVDLMPAIRNAYNPGPQPVAVQPEAPRKETPSKRDQIETRKRAMLISGKWG